jgi:hypothetical protein
MSRRAIFFTLDSIFAILVVGTLSFFIFQNLERTDSGVFSENNLLMLSEGTMASLEKGGALEESLSNSTAVLARMSVAPTALCWQIELTRADGATLASAKKAGCDCGAGRSVYSRRAVVFRNSTSAVFATARGRFCFS